MGGGQLELAAEAEDWGWKGGCGGAVDGVRGEEEDEQ